MGTIDRIVVLVGFASGVIGIYQFVQQQPWFWYAIPGALTVLILYPFAKPFFSIWHLKKNLQSFEEFLKENSIDKPVVIIAFDRSSAIVGGMLAQRMGVGELLSLPRSTTTTNDELAPRSIFVGEKLELQLSAEDLKKSLVFIFQLRTGSTFESGMSAILQEGERYPGSSVAMYATEGAKARFPSLKIFRTIKEGKNPNATFPWISGKYIHK